MHDTQPSPDPSPLTTLASRRALVRWSAGAAGAAVFASIPGARWTHTAAAQDDVILTAAASEIGASPGAAFARSAAAEAAAARGAARVQAAAALAEADSDDGAITQSPVAHAIAIPGVGAEAQSARAVASASSHDDADDGKVKAPVKVIAPEGGGGRGGRRAAGGGGGRRARGGGRAMRVGRGGRRGRGGGRDRVGELPSSGIGSLQSGPLAPLFAAASALAALGAVAVRRGSLESATQAVMVED